MRTERFEVGQSATAVPTARRAAVSCLRGRVPDDVVDAVELVVSELTGNALLHAAPPVVLVVGPGEGDGAARVEVHDGSRTLPVRNRASARPGEQGLTGRGLGLIDAVSAAWGIEATAHGKAVWVELTPASVRAAEPGSDVDLDDLLDAFEDWPQPGVEQYAIALPEVPTDLLLAAKEHVDSVVRELALTATGAASGVSAALPPHLSDLAVEITSSWSEVRQAIKRQAVAAAERGEQRTALHLSLPASAADDGERYLAALEQADTYGRASRLLTLAAPPQHRAFHRWYVTSVVDAVRRAAAGEVGVVPPSFESHLLREIDHLATLQQVSERSARLQRASAALSGALSARAVAETVLAEAVADLGALRGLVLVPSADGGPPRAVASSGWSPERLAAAAQHWLDGARTPSSAAWESSTAVWLESLADVTDLADLARVEPDAAAACAVPLQVSGHDVGLLSLSFLDSRLFSDDERAFLRALAAVAAQALERASLHESQAEVADRLTRLQAVTTALTAAHDLDEVLDVTLEHATGLVGAWRVALVLLGDDGRTLQLERMVPSIGDQDRWATFGVDDPLPASEAVRTGEVVFAATIAERDARWPAIAKYAREVEHSMVVLPLRAEGGTVGAVSLAFPASGREPDRALLRAFADACAQSVQRAQAADRARTANERLAFLARASAELASSLDVERTLAGIARLAVPAVGDWCVVHLLQEGELRALAVEHVDPAKTELAWYVQRRWPSRLSDPRGVAQVVRTGEPQLIPDIPGLRAAMAQAGVAVPPLDPEHEELMAGLGLVSALIVPLQARGRTLGALTFIAAESGRRYDEDDLAYCLDLAQRAAVALDNARLFSAASERAAAGLPDAVIGDRAQRALEAAAAGRFTVDLASGRVEADPRLSAFFGYGPDVAVARLADLTDRVHPDDQGRVQAALTACVQDRADFAVDHRVVLPSGEQRWVSARGRVVDEDGRPQLVGVAHDTTTLRDVHERTSRLLETMADAFFRLDRDWRFSYVNGQAEKLLFRGREELLGRSIWDEFPDAVDSPFDLHCRQAVESGRQISFEADFTPLGSWFEVRASPDADGLSVFFHDVTVRKHAEQARAQASRRLALLAEATRELVGALDPDEVLARITGVLVPAMGEWVVAGLVDDAGALHRARAVHADPARTGELERLVQERPEALETVPRVSRVLTTGVGELVAAPNPAPPPDVDPAVARAVDALGYGSAVVVPLAAGDAVLGVICLLSPRDEPPFTADDLATTVDIGRRAGLAVQNAQLFERQRTAVEVLQRSMLSAMPSPDDLDLTARYRAAGTEAQVGGDWYDAFLQPDGATVLVIGDVIGHDTVAAAAMGQLRSLLRGTAYDRQESPARVLSRVDTALRGLRIDTLATVLVARMEQSQEQRRRGARTLRWSSAGHPPAVLARADGRVELLDAGTDLLLGLDDATDRRDHVVEVWPGDTLLLYTDGLVERRDSDLSDGIELLREALAALARLPVEQLCDALLERLLPSRASDDVALVALRVRPVPAVPPPAAPRESTDRPARA